MSNTIQIRRGPSASLPVLNAGELGFATDTYGTYIGDGAANHELLKVEHHEYGTAAGQMSFWDGSKWAHTETSEVFWDDSNKRLGVNELSPTARVHITGDNWGAANLSEMFGSKSFRLQTRIDSESSILISTTGSSVIGIQAATSASVTFPITLQPFGGYVGIGTGVTAPLAKLHINGGVGSLATGLAFGDGNTGIYESSDNILTIALAGSDKFKFNDSWLRGTGGNRSAAIYYTVGTLANPVYSFEGDFNTGVTSFAYDQLSLITGGVEAIRIDASQNVGVGTTAYLSSYGFHIKNTPGRIRISNEADVSGGQYLFLGSPNYDLVKVGSVVTTGTGSAYLSVSVALENVMHERLMINPSGNVSIGNTNNAYKLDVGSGSVSNVASFTGDIGVMNIIGGYKLDFTRGGANYITATNGVGYLYFRTAGGNNSLRLNADTSALFYDTVTINNIPTSTSDSIIVETSGVIQKRNLSEMITGDLDNTYLRLDTANDPLTDLLEITKQGATSTYVSTLKLTSSGSYASSSHGIDFYSATSVNSAKISVLRNGSDDNYHLTFSTYGTLDVLTERMRISDDGNVLIGTTTDSGSKITIQQTSDSNGIRVYGYDDQSGKDSRWYINSSGNSYLTSSGALALAVNDGTSDLALRAGSTSGIVDIDQGLGLRVRDGKTVYIAGTTPLVFNGTTSKIWGSLGVELSIQTSQLAFRNTSGTVIMLMTGGTFTMKNGMDLVLHHDAVLDMEAVTLQQMEAAVATENLWDRDSAGFLYPATGTDKVVVGGSTQVNSDYQFQVKTSGAHAAILQGAGDTFLTIRKAGTPDKDYNIVNEGNRLTFRKDNTSFAGFGNTGGLGIGTTAAYQSPTVNQLWVEGNVGIGTTSPAYKLDVSGTGRFTGTISSTSTNGWTIGNLTNTARIYYTSGSGLFSALTHWNSYATLAVGNATVNGQLTVTTINNAADTVENILVEDSGVVKYRTISSVIGDELDSVYLRLDTANDPLTGNLEIRGATNPYLLVKDSTNNLELLHQAFDSYAVVGTGNNYAFSLYQNSTRVLTIDTAQNIGIGIASGIDQKLHIEGTGTTLTQIETTAINTEYTGVKIKTPVGYWGLFVGASAHSTIAGDLGFYDGDAGEYRMTLKDSGNLLVGTTTDSGYKLDVSGNAQIGDGGGASVLNFNNTSYGAVQFAGNTRFAVNNIGTTFGTVTNDGVGQIQVKSISASRYFANFYASTGSGFAKFYQDSNNHVGLYMANSAGTSNVYINPAGFSYFKGGNVMIGGSADTGHTFQVNGNMSIATIANAADTVENLLVTDGGTVKYRTIASVIGDELDSVYLRLDTANDPLTGSLRLNQTADSVGYSVYGYDDKSTSSATISINAIGHTVITSTGDLLLNNAATKLGILGVSSYIYNHNYGSANGKLTFDNAKIYFENANVGIGTTTPVFKTQIKGEAVTLLSIHRQNSDLLETSPVGISFGMRGDTGSGSSDQRAGIYYEYNGDLYISAKNSVTDLATSPKQYARIFIDGNNDRVGINTTAPQATFDVRSAYSHFGANSGDSYFKGNELNFGYYAGANYVGYINWNGYNHGTSQFRDLHISDGKNGVIAFFDGSTKEVGFGTVNPERAVHVLHTDPYILVEQAAASGSAGMMFRSGDSTGYTMIRTTDGDDFQILTRIGGDTQRFRIAGTTGYVTINNVANAPITDDNILVWAADNSIKYRTVASVIGDELDSVYLRLDTANDATLNRFDLSGTFAGTTVSSFTNLSATGYGLGVRAGTGSLYAFNVVDYSNSYDIFTAKGSGEIYMKGNVGIGTTSPDTNLEVETGGLTYTRFTGNRGDGNDLHIANLEFSNSYTSVGVIAEIRAITGNTGTQSTKGQLAFYTDDGLTYAERARIDSTGNVGIGTTSPDTLLHLYRASGDTFLKIESVALGDPTILFQSGNDRLGVIDFNDGTTTARFNFDHSTSKFEFKPRNSSTVDAFISETTNYFGGNVGIGTATPATKLDAAGTIRSTAQTIPTSGAGVELIYDNSTGYVVSYDRTGSSYKALRLYGSTIALMEGNVGIGTASPRGLLDITTTGSDAELHIGTTTYPATNLIIGHTRRYNYYDVIIGRNLSGTDGSDVYKTVYTHSSGGYNGIEYKNGSDIVFYAFDGATVAGATVVPTARMMINGSTGNVLIGTTTDSGYKLAVLGTSFFSDDIQMSSGKKIYFRSGTDWSIGQELTPVVGASNVTDGALVLEVYNVAAQGLLVRNNGNTGLFEIGGTGIINIPVTPADAGATDEVLRITSGGDIVASSVAELIGDMGYWDRTGSTLTPATVGDDILMSGGDFYIKTSGGTARARLRESGDLSLYNSVGTGTVFISGDQGTASYINNAGNVGIGTTSPLAKLHVKDGNTLSSALTNTSALIEGFSQSILQIASHSSGYSQIAFGDQDDGFDGGFIYSNASRYLSIETANAERMRITSGGNVGIGTTSPDYLLDLYKSTGTSSSATGTTLQQLWNYVGSDLSQQKTFVDFVFQDDNSNEYPQVRIGAEVGQNGDANSLEKEGSGAFVIYTNNATGVGPGTPTGLAERFRVDYQGNVGIGTTSPAYKLDVSGSTRIQTPAAAGYAHIFSDNNGAIYSSNGDLQFYTNNAAYNTRFFSANKGTPLLNIAESGIINIATTPADAGATDEVLRITSGGDIVASSVAELIGDAIAIPDTQIAVGTGTGITGNANFIWNDSAATFRHGTANEFSSTIFGSVFVPTGDGTTNLTSTGFTAAEKSQYKLKVFITGDTSTQTGVTYLIRNDKAYTADPDNFTMRLVSRSGSASNHLRAVIDSSSGLVSVAHYHPSATYTLAWEFEELGTNNENSFHLFGAHYGWVRDVNTLYYAEGSVGIAVTDPEAQLELGAQSGKIFQAGITSNNWAANYALGLVNANGMLLSKNATSNNSYRLFLFYRHDTAGNQFQIYNNSNVNTINLNAAGHSWLNGGNISIGTSTDNGEKLQVLGATRFDSYSLTDPDSTSRTNYAAAHMFTHYNEANGVSIIGGEGGFDGTTLTVGEETSASSAFNLFRAIADTNGTPITQFVVRGDGYTAIGQTTPIDQLTVKSANSTGITLIDGNSRKFILRKRTTDNSATMYVDNGTERAFMVVGESNTWMHLKSDVVSLTSTPADAGSTDEILRITSAGAIVGSSVTELAGDIGLTGNYVLKSGDSMQGHLVMDNQVEIRSKNAALGERTWFRYIGDDTLEYWNSSGNINVKGTGAYLFTVERDLWVSTPNPLIKLNDTSGSAADALIQVEDSEFKIGTGSVPTMFTLDLTSDVGTAYFYGNIGLKTTPEDWYSAGSVIEAPKTSFFMGNVTDIHMNSNVYIAAAGGWKYKSSNKAANYYQYLGEHFWRVAGSGLTDAAVNWNYAMKLHNSGNLSVGNQTDSGYKVDISGSFRAGTNTEMIISGSYPYTASIINSANAGNVYFQAGSTLETKIILGGPTHADAGLGIYTNAIERINVNLAGDVNITNRLLINNASDAALAKLLVGDAMHTGSAAIAQFAGFIRVIDQIGFHGTSSGEAWLGVDASASAFDMDKVLIHPAATDPTHSALLSQVTSAVSGMVTGTGTASYIPVWQDANTLGNSAMTSDATYINVLSRRFKVSTGTATLTLGQWDGTNNRIESANMPLFLTTYTGTIKLGLLGSVGYEMQAGSNHDFKSGTATFGGTVSITKGTALRLISVSAGTPVNMGFFDGSTEKWRLYKETNNHLYLYNPTTSKFPFHIDPSDNMFLNEDAGNLNVGINTDQGYQLHVQGTSNSLDVITGGLRVTDNKATGYIAVSDGSGNLIWTDPSAYIYTLPVASASVLGGVKISYVGTPQEIPLEIAGTDKAYITLTKAGIEAVLTGAITTHTHAGGVTINNNADNRLITGSGTADTLNGESTLTYNGSSLFLLDAATNATIQVQSNEASVNGTSFVAKHSRAGSYLLSGDAIGSFNMYDSHGHTAGMSAYATQNHASSDYGSELRFMTTIIDEQTASLRATINDSGLSLVEGLTVNSGLGNYDTQISGDSIENLFYVDASADSAGIKISTPKSSWHVYSNQSWKSSVLVSEEEEPTPAITNTLADETIVYLEPDAGKTAYYLPSPASDRVYFITIFSTRGATLYPQGGLVSINGGASLTLPLSTSWFIHMKTATRWVAVQIS